MYISILYSHLKGISHWRIGTCPLYLLRNSIVFLKLSVNERFYFELLSFICHCYNLVILEALHKRNALKLVVWYKVGRTLKIQNKLWCANSNSSFVWGWIVTDIIRYFMLKINELILITNWSEIHNTSPFLYEISRIWSDRKQLSSCQKLGQWGNGEWLLT